MKIKVWKKGDIKEIKIKNVSDLAKKYLKNIDASSIGEASLNWGEKLFRIIIKDFKKGNLSVDDLSLLGFEIFHGVGKHYPGSKLFQASLSASELSFSMRSKSVYSNIEGYLEDIDKFYNLKK